MEGKEPQKLIEKFNFPFIMFQILRVLYREKIRVVQYDGGCTADGDGESIIKKTKGEEKKLYIYDNNNVHVERDDDYGSLIANLSQIWKTIKTSKNLLTHISHPQFPSFLLFI